ncbi:diaminopimelate decarboxylase [Limosilactobacillus reuteri]|uniref:Diaminopimelate decarboxylase n=1 Tax=Limosilactobacillus reuteri TaxID=1598 RepID=A0AB73PE15_LIMRT|nr:diaminopimelate decarboxylase [Limosilactobacillus reuteri]MCT3208444.1 diaminopimelate decarboxylase [Limosilactobacillus reuteri]MCT3216180.1 diaminopimelate decarboxylase [Limosilactobacillus reuteri]OYS89532.1 diaminopimelate decarboxylase [Limosilactobacillus reuteri]OYS92393.1 diaminopimelate decarboxylase [Limosilactobacillus reuteri]OYS92445.1 diaminopimelate decarboxylase [Limosilactobacillus reuteri]
MNEQITDQQLNAAGHLTIGGCDAIDLAHRFGTPLVVYDVQQIRHQIRAFKQVFEENSVDYAVSYASKAFSAIAMYQVVAVEGAHVDVVSGGELYTAIKAGFPMANVSFHGNNKSREELEMAIDHHVGTIMIDNFHEIELLADVLEEHDAHVDVMLRITPGISAHTNKYIQTGQVDSKFGFDLQSGQADEALAKVLENPRMQMKGLHAHIGSQIFELAGFEGVAKKLVEVAAHWQEKFNYQAAVINVGGGFGIRYVKDDTPLAPEEFVAAIIKAIKTEIKETNLTMPAIWIEPGRSIAGPAGYNLYTVGSRKDVPGLKPYVTVDGGMGDNIRPALYEAQYETVLANNPRAEVVEHVRMAGKYCESGDILSQNQALPATKPGDVLAMLDTGAYGYSMASNYNRNPRPAVVFAEKGTAQVVIKRETYDDLIHLDEPYQQ